MEYPADGLDELCTHWQNNPEEFVCCTFATDTGTVQCAICPPARDGSHRPRLLGAARSDSTHYLSRQHLDAISSHLSYQGDEHRKMLLTLTSERYRRSVSSRTPVRRAACRYAQALPAYSDSKQMMRSDGVKRSE